MPRTVLVVDDSAAFRATAQVLLKARGYEVVGAAGDLASAHAAAAELRPDCVLLDVNLPDGDGVTMARQFRGPWSCWSPRWTSGVTSLSVQGHAASCPRPSSRRRGSSNS